MDWRWLRAGVLAPTRRRLDPRIDDDWVAHARIVRRACARWPAATKGNLSAISAAGELWGGAGSEVRSALEARLLTPLPIQRVAEVCGLCADVVEAYHAVFFDVRPRLSATDWLLREAVRWRPTTHLGVPEMGQLWKYLALVGGEKVLEVAIAVTTGRALPEWLTDSFHNSALDEAQVRLKVKLSLSAMTVNTPQAWKAVAAIRKRLRKLEGDGRPSARLSGGQLPGSRPRSA